MGFINYPIADLYVFYFCSLHAETVEWLRARNVKNPGLSLSAGSANDQLSGLGTLGSVLICQFPFLWNGHGNSIYLIRLLLGLKEMIHLKGLKKYLGYNKFPLNVNYSNNFYYYYGDCCFSLKISWDVGILPLKWKNADLLNWNKRM